jgi:hypothetical protein
MFSDVRRETNGVSYSIVSLMLGEVGPASPYLKVFGTLRRVNKGPDLAVIRVEPPVFIECAHAPNAVSLVVFSSSLLRREREAAQRLLQALRGFHLGGGGPAWASISSSVATAMACGVVDAKQCGGVAQGRRRNLGADPCAQKK